MTMSQVMQFAFLNIKYQFFLLLHPPHNLHICHSLSVQNLQFDNFTKFNPAFDMITFQLACKGIWKNIVVGNVREIN